MQKLTVGLFMSAWNQRKQKSKGKSNIETHMPRKTNILRVCDVHFAILEVAESEANNVGH